MTSAKVAIQKAVVARCRAALTALGYADAAARVVAHRAPDGLDLPYVIVGTATETRGLHSDKDQAEAEGTHTIRCYAADPDDADAIAGEVIREVTTGLSPTGFRLLDVRLDLRTTRPERDPATGDVYGEVLRFRIRTIHIA